MSEQVQKVKDLIIACGGLHVIETQIGIQHFKYYVAGEVGCTPRKAEDYITLLKRSAIAKARIDEILGKNHDSEEVHST